MEDPLLGTTLAERYDIRSHAYDEALGRVYKAFDAQQSRLVHVKVLSPAMANDAAAFQRFGREITASFMVTHPHTVEVLDFGDAEGMLYLVLEYINAHEVSQEVVRGRLDPLRVAAILGQIAGAVGAAHQEGIVHRNLCPDTVLLLENVADGDYAKVRDFGMSKLETNEETGGLTTVNERLGVAAYTAPEQMRRQQPVPQTDLFALGVVLYELLVGRPAFDGADAVEVGQKIITGSYTPLSEVMTGAPELLGQLLDEMLAIDIAERIESADELAEALDELVTEEAQTELARQVLSLLPEAPAPAEPVAAVGTDALVEALADEAEMAAFCGAVAGPKMINLLEGGHTPHLPPDELQAIGFTIAAFPLTLLSSALRAMNESLEVLKTGRPPDTLMDFAELRRLVGFDAYDRDAARYADDG